MKLTPSEFAEIKQLKAEMREIAARAQIRDGQEALWAEVVGRRLDVDLTTCKLNLITGDVIEPPNAAPVKKKKARRK